MRRRGASASCRKNSLSAGIARMPAGSLPRERTWKESRQTPSAGWPAAATIRHAWSYSLTWRPQASASYATRRPRAAARSASACSCSAARSSSATDSGCTVEAHEHRVGAEGLHDVELRLGAPQVALQHRVGHALEVPERLVERDPQAQRGRPLAAPRTGVHGEPMRSGSKSSTASKPASEAARSFSSSVPLRQTVARPLSTRPPPRPGARSARACDRDRGAPRRTARTRRRPGRPPCALRRACGTRARALAPAAA